jgi:hypothetical protein
MILYWALLLIASQLEDAKALSKVHESSHEFLFSLPVNEATFRRLDADYYELVVPKTSDQAITFVANRPSRISFKGPLKDQTSFLKEMKQATGNNPVVNVFLVFRDNEVQSYTLTSYQTSQTESIWGLRWIQLNKPPLKSTGIVYHGPVTLFGVCDTSITEPETMQ